MIVHVAEAAAALQAHDDILILTHRRPDGDTRRLRRRSVPRSASDRQAGVYSGESGDHKTLCADDYRLLSSGGFQPSVYRFDRYCRGKAVPRYGGAV
ncbi:MAG: hypothetical protein ACLR4Z_13610 [Butyricicoccaceae bacterium]